jgi:hypothetical protein
VWVVFGWAALVLDGGVHGTVDAVGWLAARPWLVGAAALALAALVALQPAWMPPLPASHG